MKIKFKVRLKDGTIGYVYFKHVSVGRIMYVRTSRPDGSVSARVGEVVEILD